MAHIRTTSPSFPTGKAFVTHTLALDAVTR
ncbi:MAG: hypothetical protein QOJ37_1740, partial [Pseudonocardiales bacterium]|nr:hypothetical protein [Pseudonocardiales bacterium]